jgi:hypothetical protein
MEPGRVTTIGHRCVAHLYDSFFTRRQKHLFRLSFCLSPKKAKYFLNWFLVNVYALLSKALQ